MLSLFPPPQPPLLPEFSNILIAGPYHQSAPIHLALSTNVIASGSTIIFAPSKGSLKESLQNFNDSWLTAHSGEGAIAEITSKITIFYPPTPAHLSLLLSLLCVSNDNNNLHHIRAGSKTLLSTVPRLIIFTELSNYFSNTDDSDASISSNLTLSSYLNLLNRIFLSICNMKQSLSDAPPKFAFFDSRLSDIKLPVVNQQQKLFPDASNNHPQDVHVLPLVERLFEWVGIFEEDSDYVPSSQDEEDSFDKKFKHLRMYRPNKEGATIGNILCWTEETQPSNFGFGLRETVFKGYDIRGQIAL